MLCFFCCCPQRWVRQGTSMYIWLLWVGQGLPTWGLRGSTSFVKLLPLGTLEYLFGYCLHKSMVQFFLHFQIFVRFFSCAVTFCM
ncbi:hypothetical protein M440DRAFT_1227295 [Trichoderma longibrachiatum ATCC 18648]|uniref:Uncharacterized protein n=1 Tax=Trichoderma longibrachiatum ATCC 18648 TaxID=983965 RepID=A0A2T4C8J4_TRILO|nr:hypothetical protein M440DRAFT_1227295 [Trichoderma longibrachiatum ATCC 18648]